MSASRTTTVIFVNQSNAYLTRTSWDLAHGIWTANALPPEQIGAGSTSLPVQVSWECESQGFMTGIEGQVVYTLQDGQTTLTVYWDNPYWSDNEYDITLNGQLENSYQASYSGGSDEDATVTFTLVAST